MTKSFIFLALVAVFARPNWAIDAGCDFYQNVAAGTKYYVYNSEYPNNYNGQRSCRWYAKSDTNVKLSCQTFSLPASTNCIQDRLSISPSGDLQLADAHNYCGTGTFEIISDGNSMNIVLTAPSGTRGGRFLCTLEATTASSQTCNCGWKKQMRIVGGTDAGTNEFPSMAGLVNMEEQIIFCGATIISSRHVLTAAHCRINIPNSVIGVLVGEHDTSTSTDTKAAVLHLIESFLTHPLYNSETHVNDVALVTVATLITFTLEVGPACLPLNYRSTSFAGSKVTGLGWGTTEYAGHVSNVLQKVDLDVIQVATCQKTFSAVTNSQICTFTPGKDTCQYDSGGPLLWQNPSNSRLYAVGITSYGQACAEDTPGVSTRVGAFVDWIISQTPGVTYCRL